MYVKKALVAASGRIAIFILVSVCLSSCYSRKNLVYLQDPGFSSEYPTLIKNRRPVYKLQANDVLNMKQDISSLIKQAMDIQSQELAKVSRNHIEAIRMEMTILDSFKRIYTLLKRIAKKVAPPEVH